jgi:hypothetical protein
MLAECVCGCLADNSPLQFQDHIPCTEMHIGLLVKCPLLLSDFNQNWLCSQILVKLSYNKFHTHPFTTSQVVAKRQMDGQTGHS